MNGVLNFSVLDGWWLEGYVKGAGWALTDKRTYENQAHQDQLDAATIYHLLEREIIPMYYARNSKGYSPEWVQTIKNSVTKITPRFTTKRMMDDYFAKFYNKLAKRHALLLADNFKKAKELAAWKENIAAHWDNIELVSLNIPEPGTPAPNVGDTYTVKAEIDVNARYNPSARTARCKQRRKNSTCRKARSPRLQDGAKAPLRGLRCGRCGRS